MGNQLILIFILTIVSITSSLAQPKVDNIDFRVLDDSAKMDILNRVNFGRYIGKKIKSFVSNDTIKYFQGRDFIETKPYFLGGVELEYSDYIYIKVYIGNAKYQKQTSPNQKWNYGLLRKERITGIKLLWGSKVIKSAG